MILHRFAPISRSDEYEYWRSFAALWRRDATIVNVEWDMEFSLELVSALLGCPHPLCAHAYQMHVPRNYYAHSHNADGIGGHWIAKGEEWAAYSAIGFCKITPEVRRRPLAREMWRLVEQEVNRAVVGRWHIHWPEVSHYHTKEGQRIEAECH